MKVLIPAYQPDERLLSLVAQIKEASSYGIVIVDDGSGRDYQCIFAAARMAGCTVLHSETNEGKGCALKKGFKFLCGQRETDGVVCADCDGQHTAQDILRVAEAVMRHPSCMVLGVRRFVGKVPLRSRVGNDLTRSIFSFVTGCTVQDTQTGLRGYSADMLSWLCGIKGNRFEYELNLLLEAQQAGYRFYELPIATVYENKNRSSHFRPVVDSVRVYLPILKFSASSLLSAALDFILLLLLQSATHNLLFSAVMARICSSVFNYMCNKTLVFKKHEQRSTGSASKYFALAFAILLCNYALLTLFTGVLGFPLAAAKILTESILFLSSYWVQKRIIFSRAV